MANTTRCVLSQPHSGLSRLDVCPQGSAFRATLGFETQSLRDCGEPVARPERLTGSGVPPCLPRFWQEFSHFPNRKSKIENRKYLGFMRRAPVAL
jgi:hypothetical protein